MGQHLDQQLADLLQPDLQSDPSLPEPALDAMLHQVRVQAAAESTGLRGWLLEQSWLVRVVIAGSTALFLGIAVVAIQGLRPDLTTSEWALLAGVSAAVLAVCSMGWSLALRPMHRPPLGASAWLAALCAASLPLVLAGIPHVWPGSPDRSWLADGRCLSLGVTHSVIAVVLLWGLDRGRALASWRLLLAAGSGGLLAYAFLHLHCTSNAPQHLLVGHGLGGMSGAAMMLLVRRSVAQWSRELGRG